MARPKSYTQNDIINAANQLIEKGTEISGWQLREIIGHGRCDTLYKDLKQLIEQGHINLPDKSSIEVQPTVQEDPKVLPLPIEVQESLKLIEGQLSSLLFALVTELNASTDTHYEHLTRARLLESKTIAEEAIKKLVAAEENLLITEDRVKVQVELNEQLEQDNIALEEQLSTAELHSIKQLETMKSVLSENKYLLSDLDSCRINTDRLNEQASTLTKQNTVLEIQLNNCQSKIEKQRETESRLVVDLDHVSQQLTILSTKYEGIIQAEAKLQAKLESAVVEVAESKKLEAVLSEKIRHLKKHQRIMPKQPITQD
jgi:chromosome segregation ATPase